MNANKLETARSKILKTKIVENIANLGIIGQNIIRKTSQNYLCISECRYKARTAVTPILFGVYNPTFTNELGISNFE